MSPARTGRTICFKTSASKPQGISVGSTQHCPPARLPWPALLQASRRLHQPRTRDCNHDVKNVNVMSTAPGCTGKSMTAYSAITVRFLSKRKDSATAPPTKSAGKWASVSLRNQSVHIPPAARYGKKFSDICTRVNGAQESIFFQLGGGFKELDCSATKMGRIWELAQETQFLLGFESFGFANEFRDPASFATPTVGLGCECVFKMILLQHLQ